MKNFSVKTIWLKTTSLKLMALTLLAGMTAPAIANSGCYILYPGQDQDLQSLCNGGSSEDASLQFRETLPMVQNVGMGGDFAQGRRLEGEVYNPHGYTSDGVTLFYAVHTNREVRSGTVVVPALAAYDTTSVSIDLSDLRGSVQRYEIDIL